MSAPFAAELETLAIELVRRHAALRAAIVGERGDVLFVCTRGDARATQSSAVDAAPPVAREGERVAHIDVDCVDDAQWIYVDLGALRLISRAADADAAERSAAWLATQLRAMGVTVERESRAQD